MIAWIDPEYIHYLDQMAEHNQRDMALGYFDWMLTTIMENH